MQPGRNIPYTNNPDCLHKNYSPLAQKSLEKSIMQKKSLSGNKAANTPICMVIKPIDLSNQNHLAQPRTS